MPGAAWDAQAMTFDFKCDCSGFREIQERLRNPLRATSLDSRRYSIAWLQHVVRAQSTIWEVIYVTSAVHVSDFAIV